MAEICAGLQEKRDSIPALYAHSKLQRVTADERHPVHWHLVTLAVLRP